MPSLSKNRVAITGLIALFIIIFAVIAIFWARGFKPNFKNGSIERTGLIVANSVPTGAQVYLDDRLTSATDTNIAFLDPKIYKVKIQKEGYTTWEKDVEVREDLATEIKAVLFPLAPEIKPLTTTGAVNPSLSPDGGKIVYATGRLNGGIYILPMTDRPFPFRQDVKLVAKNTPAFDFTNAKFIWGPDSKQLIAQISAQGGQVLSNLLVDTDKSDQDLRDVTASLNATFTNWQQQIDAKAQTLAITVPDNVKSATAEAVFAVSTPSPSPVPSPNSQFSILNSQLNYYPSGLIFSPDEEKILYKTKEEKLKIWDLKNKKELSLPDFPDLLNISWYSDSNHLVVAQKNSIFIIEADGKNKMAIYNGKFEDGFVFAHPSGSRLIILTALTQTEGSLPNLYSINLR